MEMAGIKVQVNKINLFAQKHVQSLRTEKRHQNMYLQNNKHILQDNNVIC